MSVEDPDTGEGAFQEEGHEGFEGQGRTEDVAHKGRVLGPIGPELDLHGYTCDDPDHEVYSEEVTPEVGVVAVDILAGFQIFEFKDYDKQDQPDGERHHEEVKSYCEGKLNAAEQYW